MRGLGASLLLVGVWVYERASPYGRDLDVRRKGEFGMCLDRMTEEVLAVLSCLWEIGMKVGTVHDSALESWLVLGRPKVSPMSSRL